MELLASFDPFLEQHLKDKAHAGRGSVSYLSKTICEEFIELMGRRVLQVILQEIKASKYYAISVDSTPDLSHVDQLTFIVRYVVDSDAVERFLKFIPIFSHRGKSVRCRTGIPRRS